MSTGTVKWFNGVRGIGFIRRDDGSPSVFFQISQLEQSELSFLKAGQKLSFDIVQSKEGRASAVNIKCA
jgi:cold shock protein